MSVIAKRGAFEGVIKNNAYTIARFSVENEFVNDFRIQVVPIIDEVAAAVEGCRPLVLPDSFNSCAPGKEWETRAVPTVQTNMANMQIENILIAYTNSKATGVIGADTTISFSASPTWDIYYRWGSTMLDDFLAIMRTVRNKYGIEWIDESVTSTDYTYQELNYKYRSKEPISIITRETDEVDYYGEKYNTQSLSVYVAFRFELPRPPKDYVGPNCTTVEEEIVEQATRKIKRKRIICS